MPDQLFDRPVLHDAPTGYFPKGLQMHKVRGAGVSINENQTQESLVTPTSRSKSFMRRVTQFAKDMSMGGVAVGSFILLEGAIGSNGFATQMGAITTGISAAGFAYAALRSR